MTLKLQAKWEAERIARIVESYGALEPQIKPWCADVVGRIRRQVENTKKYFSTRQYEEGKEDTDDGGWEIS